MIPETFIKAVPESDRRAKILYLMGITWHNRCMFDIDTVEDSMADLLQQRGIESYSFDIIGSGPRAKTSFVGNQHQANIDYAVQLINEHKIDYVFGYSYGVILAREVALRCNLKGAIFLDPFSNIALDHTLSDDGDKFIYTREQIAKGLVDYQTNINPVIQADYLKKVSDEELLVTASYPKDISKASFAIFKDPKNILAVTERCELHVFLTKTPLKGVFKLFPQNTITFNPVASHWILLEDHRHWLADQISHLIK